MSPAARVLPPQIDGAECLLLVCGRGVGVTTAEATQLTDPPLWSGLCWLQLGKNKAW